VVGDAGEKASDLLRAFRPIFEEANRAWNEGDIERAYGALPQDFEYHLAATWPQARPLRGPDEIVEFFKEWHEAFPDTQSTNLEFIQVDERSLILGFDVGGTGASSGARTAMEIWQVWEWRVAPPLSGGDSLAEETLPFRVREFGDRRAALEAAGAAEAERERNPLRMEGE
jgi:SnoaL-like protein